MKFGVEMTKTRCDTPGLLFWGRATGQALRITLVAFGQRRADGSLRNYSDMHIQVDHLWDRNRYQNHQHTCHELLLRRPRSHNVKRSSVVAGMGIAIYRYKNNNLGELAQMLAG